MAPEWQVMGRSVLGASHRRGGLPNQDSLGAIPELDAAGKNSAPAAILAVSDGHGSARSFRSDRGSRFAVEAVGAVLGELFLARSLSLSAVRRLAEVQLPSSLLRRWRRAVAEDLRAYPVTGDELERLEKRVGSSVRQRLEESLGRLTATTGEAEVEVALANNHDVLAVYGATLLAVVATESYLIYAQLGDGDILAVDAQGRVQRPFARDERLIANETTSLCSPAAERELRLAYQPLADAAPVLILASTDGYANSFRDEASFLLVGSDLLEMVCRDGLAGVGRELAGWLDEASQVGSGDDVTLGLLCRVDALAACRPWLEEREAEAARQTNGEEGEASS